MKNYGYKTSAFGKWHNTPADQTTAMGPFTYWPTGYGFEYFYGFLAGETSQWEPRLVENTTAIEPPHDEKYHLTEDMADQGITWLKKHRAFSPDKPFFMYWAPGGVHGPHHVTAQWADKYKGKFDQGWDKLREEIFARQKAARLDSRQHRTHAARPDHARVGRTSRNPSAPFRLRLMELYAGFVEHTDAQVGKLVDFLDQTGQRENTIIFYIWGDNGSSAEGQNGSISELLAQNQIPNTIAQQIKALDELGGLKALGGPLTDNIYHAGWAWAGSTPFRSHQARRLPLRRHAQSARRFLAEEDQGGQDAALAVLPRQRHRPDALRRPRHQGAEGSERLHAGSDRRREHGRQSFTDAKAPENKHVQYFDNNGSDGIYQDGWYACTFGPLSPWLNAQPGLDKWDSSKAVWELYDLTKDFSQMHDLAKEHPEKLEEMKKLFLAQAKENKVFPIGAGIWLRIHPEDRIKTPYTSWTFDDTTTRMPEFTAPALGNHNNTVTIDLECGADASGVLYALGGSGGGLTCYMDKGQLVFEYNLMIIDRSIAKSAEKIAPGKHTIVVDTTLKAPKPGAPADIVLSVDGKEVARTTVKMTVPAAFTASESFDVGIDLGSTVSRDYFERRPFKFDGKIEKVEVKLK